MKLTLADEGRDVLPSSASVAYRSPMGSLLSLAVYCQYMYNRNMYLLDGMTFEWDEAKAASNLEKHGVAFEEATFVFDDPYARVIGDPDHSDEEERFIILGNSIRANLLTVCHCYRESNGSVRIISARGATKREANEYWRYRHEG